MFNVVLNCIFSTSHFVIQTMDLVKQMLDAINVTYDERVFESEDGIAGLGSEPFVSDSRTTILLIRFTKLFWSYHLIHRIPASEYTSLRPMLCMQDHCSVR